MTNKGSKSSLLKEDTDKEEGLNEGRAGYPDMSLEEKS